MWVSGVILCADTGMDRCVGGYIEVIEMGDAN